MSSLAKVHSVLEKFWWSMTAVTLVLIIIFSIRDGFDSWKFFLFLPLLTVVMALLRRFLRKKLEKSEAIRDEREGKKK